MGRVLIVALAWAAVAAAGHAQDSRTGLEKDLAALFAEQRYEDLLTRVEPALSESPETAALWMMAAEAALKLEDFPRAVRCFEKSLALAPALKAAAINLGFAYLKVDRTEDAEKHFVSFIEDKFPVRRAHAHYGLGLAQLARGDHAAAAEEFQLSASLVPADMRPVYRLGQIFLQSGEHARAIAAFSAVLEKDELHHGAAYGLARAYALAGRDSDAKTATERHRAILDASDAVAAMIRKLGQAGDPVAARVAIAEKLFEAGARRQAGRWYEKAAQIDPVKTRKLWRYTLEDILPRNEKRAESRRW
jgi:tetratricopeptide (TPR) repeat protein